MISIDGQNLSIQNVFDVAVKGEKIRVTEKARERMEESAQWVEQISKEDTPVYGINTGFGIFADRKISSADSATLSRNLILSHSVAVGEMVPEEVVRAAMLVRANTLTKGFSGVRPIIVDTLLEMLNRNVTPLVPSQGSMGSSGDLGPLSHLALVFTKGQGADCEEDSGYATFEGKQYTGLEAMRLAGIDRIVLGPKEGLAINNGATFSAAYAALAVNQFVNLINMADFALCLSLEALLGSMNAYDARLHDARGQHGQKVIADHIRQLIDGSTLVNSSDRIQDAYCLRCAPQVHGAVLDTVEFVGKTITREINAATDNPLLFEKWKAISGGNFHGEPIALAMDYLGIAAAELGAVSERRIFRLIDEKLNFGLTPMLVDDPLDAGLNSGLMMPQYTAASLVLENQTLANSDAVHSLPTSGEQEDHNANSMTAARHTRQILKNVAEIIAIELYTAAKAVDLRRKLSPDLRTGIHSTKIHDQVRKLAPSKPKDCQWGKEISHVRGGMDKLADLDVPWLPCRFD